jgi:sodium transport system permease protein
MRWSIVRSIYIKELRETLRDRRTLMFMLVLPLMLYPMMIIGMTKFQKSMEKESLQRTARLTVWGDAPPELIADLKARNFEISTNKDLPPDLAAKLANGEIAPFEEGPDTNDPDADQKLEDLRERASAHPLVKAAGPSILDRTTDAVLVVWPLPAGKEGKREMAMLYDSVRQDSRRVRGRLAAVLDEHRKKILVQREKQHSLDEGFTRALRAESRDVAPKERRSGFGISITLPFMLLAISATAGFYRAIDTTAGEKERNTMQTLLCAPVRSIEIVAGKFFAISTITMIAAGANIVSLGLTFGNVSMQLGQQGTLSPAQYLLVFAVLVPVTLLTSALFLAVGVFAKDFRDGQNLATPVMLLTMLPAGITMLPGVEANNYTVMAPFVNVALLIKALLVGEAKPDFIFLTLVSSTVYAALALSFAARVFQRETLLTGGKDTFHGLFGFTDKRREVTPSMAFAAFCAVMVLLFYGSALAKIDIRFLLVVIEYGLILLPTLALVLFLKLPLPQTLSLRWPGARPMFAAVLVGSSTWAVANALVRLLEPPQDLAKALQKVMLLDRVDIPLWWIYFIVAISPAICEELFFRGLIQGSFRKLGIGTSIVVSALLFGVAHGSIYRMMPVTLLGLVIGWLFWQSKSVYPGIVAHAINNGIAATIFGVASIREYVIRQNMQYVPWPWVFAAFAVMVSGLWLARSSPPPKDV